MFNCCGSFIWLKRAGARWTGLDGKASGVYCIMQIDAAGQIDKSQLDGPSGLSPRGIAALRLNLQTARCPRPSSFGATMQARDPNRPALSCY